METQETPTLEQMVLLRNKIRKFGYDPSCNEPTHKYDIALSVNFDIDFATSFSLVGIFEPYCSHLHCKNLREDSFSVKDYINLEQKNSDYDLSERVSVFPKDYSDILVRFKASDWMKDQEANYTFLRQLPLILSESGQVGEMECGYFRVIINSLKQHKTEI